MEPLELAIVVIACHHVPVTDCTTRTVNLGVFITLILVIFIHIVVATASIAVLRVGELGAAKERIVFVLVATGGRFLV